MANKQQKLIAENVVNFCQVNTITKKTTELYTSFLIIKVQLVSHKLLFGRHTK